MRRLLFTLAVGIPILADACFNDRDTLGYELHNRPDVQRALTGRFDRFPRRYYEMRVARLRAKGHLTPDECDDEAVALARLGRSDEALMVLADKARHPGLTFMDKYRLFANRGTIEAQKWFKGGKKSSDIRELHMANEDITQALALYPHAHFGREGTQLQVIRWLLSLFGPGRVKQGEQKTLSEWLESTMGDVDFGSSLSGLIMLGGAWESPDFAVAIGNYSFFHHNRETSLLALARYRELIQLGRKPIVPQFAADDADTLLVAKSDLTDNGELSTAHRFKVLRAEAEAWHDAKDRYMLGLLAQGRHPDTDPTFWNDWKEPPMPVLPTKLPTHYDWGAWAPTLVELSAMSFVGIGFLVLRDRRRKRQLLPNV